MDDDYEILPHQELEYLRKEVEKLKSNPFGNTSTGETLLDSINSLTKEINKLNTILESANDEMIRDYQENKTSETLSRMIEQQEKLAQGIVVIGEMINKFSNKTPENSFKKLDDMNPFKKEKPDQLPPPLSNKLPPINDMNVPPPPK